MTSDSFYDLKEPTSWARSPSTYSFSSLQAMRACPRRWQLLHSTWGSYSRFPERAHPAAIEGQIVHEALDLLGRELGRKRPPGHRVFRVSRGGLSLRFLGLLLCSSRSLEPTPGYAPARGSGLRSSHAAPRLGKPSHPAISRAIPARRRGIVLPPVWGTRAVRKHRRCQFFVRVDWCQRSVSYIQGYRWWE